MKKGAEAAMIGHGTMETQEEAETDKKKPWKGWTIGVIGSSSNSNKYATENGREIGRLLANNGYDGINGGYSTGSIGAMQSGFTEACRQNGLEDGEIAGHLKGIIFSEKVIGKTMASKWEVRQPIKITETGSLPERAGGIISGSDAIIAVEGGTGTAAEVLLSAQDEWLRKQNTEDIKPTRKPIILVDSTQMFEQMVELCEKLSPQTIDKLTPHIFSLGGGENPTAEGLPMATLANDEVMKQKLEMILELYYFRNLGQQATPEQVKKMLELESAIFTKGSKYEVMTLKERLAEREANETK